MGVRFYTIVSSPELHEQAALVTLEGERHPLLRIPANQLPAGRREPAVQEGRQELPYDVVQTASYRFENHCLPLTVEHQVSGNLMLLVRSELLPFDPSPIGKMLSMERQRARFIDSGLPIGDLQKEEK